MFLRFTFPTTPSAVSLEHEKSVLEFVDRFLHIGSEDAIKIAKCAIERLSTPRCRAVEKNLLDIPPVSMDIPEEFASRGRAIHEARACAKANLLLLESMQYRSCDDSTDPSSIPNS